MLAVRARQRLGDFTLDIAFDGPVDGITILFGPSGAGKSATLAIIAGATRGDDARVAIGDHVLTDSGRRWFVPPEKRRIGIVHQDARLFPHMPVKRNLRYGLARAGNRDRIRFDAVVDVLAIGHLLDRRPLDLSGGERQRVALGRAMLSQPDLLLLDEPVSALDAARRGEVLGFVADLKRVFALPMVYVTHSIDEARLLGDLVVRIEGGRVVATGTPDAIFPPRAQHGTIVEHHGDRTIVRFGDQTLSVAQIDAPIGATVHLSC